MDFISFNDAQSNNQNNKSKDQGKLAFGSPAVGFGSPAVSFGSPAVQNSSFSHFNKTPSPRPYSPNSSQGFTPKSPRYPYNNTPRHQHNGFIQRNSGSPRHQYPNNYNARNNSYNQNGFSPRPMQDFNNSDRNNSFKAPHNSPNRGRGMGRKSMTWTYGQVNIGTFYKSIKLGENTS